MFAHRKPAAMCYNIVSRNRFTDQPAKSTMPNNPRNRSIEESRLPQGTFVIAALVVVLGAGIYLIVSGLF
jgi:hypothetical protein